MYKLLRNLNLDALSIDEGIALLAYGSTLVAEYERRAIDVPEWLTNNLQALDGEVNRAHRAELQRKLREAQARMDSLKTPAEKRKELDGDIKRLQDALGV